MHTERTLRTERNLWAGLVVVVATFGQASADAAVTVSGKFENPVIFVPELTTHTNTGLDVIEWGTPQPETDPRSRLTFIPSPSVLEINPQTQTFGQLHFRNGSAANATWILGVDLVLNTTSNIPATAVFPGTVPQTTTLKIAIVTTSNVSGIPEIDADYIYFPDFPTYGSFRVYEGQETYVTLGLHFSSLIFDGLGGVGNTNAGFLHPSIEPFAVPEEPNAAPEPASLVLWTLAAAGCACGAYRRRRMG